MKTRGLGTLSIDCPPLQGPCPELSRSRLVETEEALKGV